MERAQAHVAAGRAHAAQAHVFAHDLDDVDRGFQLFDKIHGLRRAARFGF